MSNTPAAPCLTWTRTEYGAYQATDAGGNLWSIDRHPAPHSRQGKSEDWTEVWWLHNLTADDYTNPETHEVCRLVTRRQATALHRHPQILRFADVLAAGWWDECWRVYNGHPTSERVMRRGDDRAPLSALLGEPVMVHPQILLDLERERNSLQRRVWAAEQALRDAGVPIPDLDHPTDTAKET